MATSLSTIAYLAIPGEAIANGPAALANQLAQPFMFLVVGFVLIPYFMRVRVISAYELLEARLGLGIRLLGASMFLVFRLVWMSLLVFLGAKALSIMMGLDDSWIPWISLVTGMVAVTYTSLGGLRAVVITDSFQTVLMLGGAILVIGLVSYRMGSFDWFPTSWQPHWDEQPLFSFDPSVRLSILGTAFSTFILATCGLGGDQTKIQRLMATVDARAARQAYLVNQIVGVTVVLVLWLVGFALMGLVRSHPDMLPAGMDIVRDGDNLFPYFIAHLLPPGISGLVAAAMLAAAMSSIDSGVNSITAVVNPRLPGPVRPASRRSPGPGSPGQGHGLRHRRRRGGRNFLHGSRPRQHLRGGQEDLRVADDADVRALLLRLLRALRPARRRGRRRRFRRDHGGPSGLLGTHLRHAPGDGRGSGELHLDRPGGPGSEPGRGTRRQLPPAPSTDAEPTPPGKWVRAGWRGMNPLAEFAQLPSRKE